MRKALTIPAVLCLLAACAIAYASPGIWVTKTPLPQKQILFGTVAVSGRIYVIGGSQVVGPWPGTRLWFDTNYEYDPLADLWLSRAPMPTPRSTLAVASVSNKIYAIGGAASTSGGAMSTNEMFDPVTNGWSLKAPMPTSRNWISAVGVNDAIYVMGGSDNSGGIFSTNEMYDPLTNTWTAKADCPTARMACGIGTVNGKIYLIGGWVRPGAPPGESTTLNEEYDPQTNTWTEKAPMPTARNGLTVAVINGKIYAIGGATDANPWTINLNTVEEYDPSTDTWTSIQSMPTARSLLGSTAIEGNVYAIGGWGNEDNLDVNEELLAMPPAIPVGGEWIPIDAVQTLVPIVGSAIVVSAIAASFVSFKRVKRKQNYR